jgi:hypothetical protein
LDRISGYDPNTGICWQFRNKGDDRWCKCPACSAQRPECNLAFFGRCRSGRRWFWMARDWPRTIGTEDCLDVCEYGWADTEDAAMAAAMAAVREFQAPGSLMMACLKHDYASRKLKELNEASRRARPAPDTSEAHAVEYLYARGHCWGDGPCGCEELTGTARWNYHLQKFQILKKTKQRIFYSRKPLPFEEEDNSSINMTDYGTAFIDRQTIEQEGKIWSHKSGGWWKADCRLYLKPPLLEVETEELPNLGKL